MLEVEKNLKIFDHGERDKRKQKEEDLPYTSNLQSHDAKVEEMSKIIKRLSSKLTKMVMERRNHNRPVDERGNKNPNQYRTPLINLKFYRERERERGGIMIPKTYNLHFKIIMLMNQKNMKI